MPAKNFSRLKKYILAYRRQIAIGLGFLLLTNIVSLIAPLILKYAIDSLKRPVNPALLLT